jgi:hypothetical protein
LRLDAFNSSSVRSVPTDGTLTALFSHRIKPRAVARLFNFAHFWRKISRRCAISGGNSILVKEDKPRRGKEEWASEKRSATSSPFILHNEPLAKFHRDCQKHQGTTLVLPKDQQEDVAL